MASLTPQQEKALNYNNHISLTANAGSGKTFVLSQRFIKIFTEESISLRNIAAITFTDKAASELYKKIAVQIEDVIANSSNKNEVRKLENLRRQLVSANISTIHSFCINILREHPVEAGLDANFTAIDDKMSDELIELSVEEMIKGAIKSPEDSNDLKYLIRYFSSKTLFSREIKELINKRKNVLSIDEKIYSKSEVEIAESFYSSFKYYFDKIFSPRLNYFINSLSSINEEVIKTKPGNQIAIELKPELTGFGNISGTENIINFINMIGSLILTQKKTINAKNYLNKNLREELFNEITIVEKFFSDFSLINLPANHAEIEIDLAHFGRLMLRFFFKALTIYSEKKKEIGCLDYEDILLFTKTILTNKSVQKDLSDKYKYIMIDEYQDTNEIQYNIFLPVVDYLKKGNLFVVGDEKQSIYMFRDAELEVFNITKQDIKTSAGEEFLISLPDSFRMASAICLFSNLLFKNLFNEPDLFYNEVEHKDIVCARQDEFKGRIEILLNNKDTVNNNDENGSDPSIEEANFISKRILKLISDEKENRKIGWGDIAVLCRKRKYFAELEKAFVNYNIPFSIVGGKGFFQKQPVYDIYNYFSFLADDKNDAALVGILRSPFFLKSDTEIFEISLQQGYGLWNKLINYCKYKPDFEKVVNLLRENFLYAKSYNVPMLLRKILNESSFLAALAAGKNGVQEIANIQKLINVTNHFFSQGFKTLYDYVIFLKESIENFEDESQAAVTREINSVKIMTLHQAKGLEFPAVFLYKSEEPLKKDFVKAKRISIDKNLGLLAKLPVGENYSSEYLDAPVLGISDLISFRKSAAEFKRLLYVGITRAKDYLFISGSSNKNNEFNENSFLGLIQSSLGIDYNSVKINLNSALQFLLEENGTFKNIEKDISVEIEIIKNIEINSIKITTPAKNAAERLFRIEQIADMQKGEIISATKLSVFSQCPVKYFLTYDLGYLPLLEKYKKWSKEKYYTLKDEFNPGEDENLRSDEENLLSKSSKGYADIRGRVIHKLLQYEIEPEQFENFVNNTLESEPAIPEEDLNMFGSLKEEVITGVRNFYKSETSRWLKSYKQFYNEYEVYSKEKDYFIYGIIDKLIIDGNNALIVDYKTDSVSLDGLNEKANGYFIQLKFYSYLVKKLFPKITSIQLVLVFIKHPGQPVIRKVDEEDFKQIQFQIENMVDIVRNNKYLKNMNHCGKCFYSTKNNNCVLI